MSLVVTVVALVVVHLAAGRAAHADARGALLPGGEVLFNQVLPAGKEVTVSFPAPGSDEISGVVEVWPADDCATRPRPHGETQHYRLGLAVAGTGADRVVSAVVPPLQIQTSYCFQLELQRGLRDDQVDALAAGLGDHAYSRFDWATACADPGVEDAVAAMIEDELGDRLGRVVADDARARAGAVGAAQPEAPIVSADVRAAAVLSAALADVRGLCARVGANDSALASAGQAAIAANAALEAATGQLRAEGGLRPTVVAWPPAVRERAAPYSATSLADALTAGPPALEAIADRIEDGDPALADELRALAGLTGDAQAAAIKALQARLRKPPGAERPLALFVPGQGRFVAAGELADPRVFASLFVDLTATPELFMSQLRLIERQGPRNADVVARWRRALAALVEAEAARGASTGRVTELGAARAALLLEIKAALAAAVKKDSVRRLLRQTTRASSHPQTGRPVATDENASWVSAAVGVAVALPFVHDGDGTGFTDPWLVPYAGVNVYLHRVDRVIDPDDLVGARFLQRNSLTVGLWLKKPTLRGAPISGMWESGPVPFVGVGHRVTPYLRVDVGVAVFQHARRLPTVTDKATGAAVWFGASIDADLWAAVSGKLGK